MFKKIIYFYNDVFEYLRFIDHLKNFESLVVELEPHFKFKNHDVVKLPIEYLSCTSSTKRYIHKCFKSAIILQINHQYLDSFVNVFKHIHFMVVYKNAIASTLRLNNLNQDFFFEKHPRKVFTKYQALKQYRNGMDTIVE